MKLKKLNNKGLTAIEILVCFILMVILVTSMYGTVTTYKNKQSLESYKEKIMSYKNLLTKEIQDDLIKKGLVDAKIVDESGAEGNTDKYYKIEFSFRDGSKKVLVIESKYARDFGSCISNEAPCINDKDDVLSISYGTEGAADYTTYPLPDLGYGYNGNKYSDYCPDKGCKIYDFRINNIIVNTDNNIFSIYIGFYHPNFRTRYGIDIVCPINYF